MVGGPAASPPLRIARSSAELPEQNREAVEMKKANRQGTTRRAILKGGTALAGTLAMPAILRLTASRARAQSAGKIVKVAPEADLKILDPAWTTATITETHAWAIYATLFPLNHEYKV